LKVGAPASVWLSKRHAHEMFNVVLIVDL
jgi:hypothetical protein